ncbi:MAG: FHA domain-containing protein [Verrucomicrobiota bacterium]
MSSVQARQAAYLLVDGITVYELYPNSTLTIGRLEHNTIVLDDYKVSREHALLKFTGEDFVLIDLASTHGTLYQEEKINQVRLNYGETFRIVSHELAVSEERPELPERDDAGFVSVGGTRSLDRRVKFFGGLNEFPLITLVQFLAQEKQTGLLMLEEGQTPGPRIYFQDGDITSVADGDRLGELLTRRFHEESLFFYFHHETEFPERTIHKPTANYLIDLVHAHDEAQSNDVNKSTQSLPAVPLKKMPVKARPVAAPDKS